MKIKSLILGSAAVFAVAGSAQAADLSVAEPVDYVRVCDAFGVGYWYIPGTDTCLKVGGFVEFTTKFHASRVTDPGDTSGGPYGFPDYNEGAKNSNWQFVTEAGINVTAKSMTEYGELAAFAELRGKYDNSQTTKSVQAYPWAPLETNSMGVGNSSTTSLDSAWLSLGPLLVGHTGSTFDYAGGFSDPVFRSDTATDQVRLSWALSGFGIHLGIEDPRDRWGTSQPTSYNMPDLIAAITASQANWDGKLSVGFSQLASASVYGVNGGITIGLDGIAPGDKLRLNAAFGTGTSYVGYGTVNDGTQTHWSAFASFQHFWSPTLSSALTGSYGSSGSANTWGVGANLVWAPVAGFSAKLEGTYSKLNSASEGSWEGKIALKRSW